VDEREAPFVRRLFAQAAEGRMTLREMALSLTEGVRGPAYGHWNTPFVRKVLSNPAYIGKVRRKGETFSGTLRTAW